MGGAPFLPPDRKAEIRNTNIEIRITEIQMLKTLYSINILPEPFGSFGHLDFDIVSDFIQRGE